MLHQITLYRARGNKDPVSLTYVEEPLRRSQARLANRTTLTAQIELDGYQCAAVIDWIDVEFELTRRTQYWHLNDLVENLTGRKEFPEALDLGEGNTATRYKLRVQEPDLGMVRKVIEAIGTKYGLTTVPSVAGIEISIDFYAKKQSAAARARLHGVLIRHFFPTTRVLKANLMWPRFMPGGIKKTGLHRRSKRE